MSSSSINHDQSSNTDGHDSFEEFDGSGQREMYFDENASFSAVFGDAYTFRNLIEYLHATNEEGTFIFGKNEIRYKQADENNTILNDVTIDISNLIEYKYDSI